MNHPGRCDHCHRMEEKKKIEKKIIFQLEIAPQAINQERIQKMQDKVDQVIGFVVRRKDLIEKLLNANRERPAVIFPDKREGDVRFYDVIVKPESGVIPDGRAFHRP